MKTTLPPISFVPYQQKDEPARRAAIAHVEFSLDGFSDNDIQVLGHLSDAVDLINPLYRDQFDPKSAVIEKLLGKLLEVASAEQKEKIDNYLTILRLQNSPYSLLPRKNHLLGLTNDEVSNLVKKAGGGSLETDLASVAHYFFEGLALPDKAGLYPDDMTEEEWKALGDEANVVNTTFHRANGKVVGALNEIKYRASLAPVIEHLIKARDLC
ncbi:hypothetical protein IT157_06710 [bacterium]|nr:hypothetical protein [bacterium]